MEWETYGNVFNSPVVDRPSATNEQLYTEGKKHYGEKKKLVISPFVSFANSGLNESTDKIREVADKIDSFLNIEYFNEWYGLKNIFKNRHLISMDISVEVYEDRNRVEDYTGEDNYISSLHMPDYMKSDNSREIDKQNIDSLLFPDFIKPYEKPKITKVTNWYHCESVWCSPYTPLTTFDYIGLGMLFHTVVYRKFFPDDISRIRVTFNKIIEK